MPDLLWTRPEIEAAVGIPASHGAEAVSGVSIDTRTLGAGDLFVAIRGETNDGHDHVTAAFAKGAAAAIVSRAVTGVAQADTAKLIPVRDTLAALNQLGQAARARSAARIVAVTGSVGKTGTKEMLRIILGASGATHASEKSYNNLWGVPLSLARMPKSAAFGAFEIGMNHAGEITPLTALVRPHVAIVTWVDAVHMEFFNAVEDIADAKAEIFSGVQPGGCAVLPAQNPHFERLRSHAAGKALEIISFGNDAQSRLVSYETTESGCRISADILGELLTFEIGVFGRHLAMNAIAALTAAKVMGADIHLGAEALAAFQAPEGRGRRQTFNTPDGPILLIDETYNASPASLRAALGVLGTSSRDIHARRIAILGDMLELGHGSIQFHQSLASEIDSNAIDLVLCAGPLMANLYDQLPPEKKGGYASTSADLISSAVNGVRGGDVVMIKGSLGSKMGIVAHALASHLTLNGSTKNSRNAA